MIFATTAHGGHLGFFEGGLLYPDTITWLDKIVIEYANAIVNTLGQNPEPEMKLAKEIDPVKSESADEMEDVRKRNVTDSENYLYASVKKSSKGTNDEGASAMGLKVDLKMSLPSESKW